MKPTFKAEELNLQDSVDQSSLIKTASKRISLRPKRSMTSNKSLKPFIISGRLRVKDQEK